MNDLTSLFGYSYKSYKSDNELSIYLRNTYTNEYVFVIEERYGLR